MTAAIGHNGGPIMGEALRQLKAFQQRIETLIDEDLDPAKAAIKDVYAEVTGAGFDVKALRKIVALRSKDREKVIADKESLELYAVALGVEDLV